MMSLKGSRTTSDYIDYSKATVTAHKLLRADKTKIMGLYIIVSINTGLRVSDVLKLTWEQLLADNICLVEQKTRKERIIAVNENIKEALKYFNKTNGYVFLSQKNSVFTVQQINRKLKAIFSKEGKGLNISTHSLRKSFGRRVYENNNESEKALNFLSELFNHTSMKVTRRYLGIRQEELNDIYLKL